MGATKQDIEKTNNKGVADASATAPSLDNAKKQGDIYTLNAGQEGVSASASTDKSKQMQSTTFNVDDPALENIRQRMLNEDPYKVLLEQLPQNNPSDPSKLKQIKRNKNAKQALSTITESLRLLSDIGFAHGGGNVYARQYDKTNEQATAQAQAERDKYQKALDAFNEKYLKTLEDSGKYKADVNKELLPYLKKTITESESNRDQYGTSSQRSASQSVIPDNKTVINNGSGGGKSDGAVELQYSTYDPRTGRFVQNKIAGTLTKDQWASRKPFVALALANDRSAIKSINSQYKELSAQDIKDILQGKKGTDYEGVRDEILQKFWNYSVKSASAAFPDANIDFENSFVRKSQSPATYNIESNTQTPTATTSTSTSTGGLY